MELWLTVVGWLTGAALWSRLWHVRKCRCAVMAVLVVHNEDGGVDDSNGDVDGLCQWVAIIALMGSLHVI